MKYWQRTWAKYQEAARLEGHTGGGDGDEVRHEGATHGGGDSDESGAASGEDDGSGASGDEGSDSGRSAHSLAVRAERKQVREGKHLSTAYMSPCD